MKRYSGDVGSELYNIWVEERLGKIFYRITKWKIIFSFALFKEMLTRNLRLEWELLSLSHSKVFVPNISFFFIIFNMIVFQIVRFIKRFKLPRVQNKRWRLRYKREKDCPSTHLVCANWLSLGNNYHHQGISIFVSSVYKTLPIHPRINCPLSLLFVHAKVL